MSIRIEFNSQGFKEILTSENMKQLVQDTADEIQSRVGDGFYSHTAYGGYGGGRWIGFVGTETQEAMKAEAENKVLSGAI